MITNDMEKNCLNCMRVLPIYDGMERVGQECMRNPGMRVNGRMVCEEWRGNAPAARSKA